MTLNEKDQSTRSWSTIACLSNPPFIVSLVVARLREASIAILEYLSIQSIASSTSYAVVKISYCISDIWCKTTRTVTNTSFCNRETGESRDNCCGKS